MNKNDLETIPVNNERNHALSWIIISVTFGALSTVTHRDNDGTLLYDETSTIIITREEVIPLTGMDLTRGMSTLRIRLVTHSPYGFQESDRV